MLKRSRPGVLAGAQTQSPLSPRSQSPSCRGTPSACGGCAAVGPERVFVAPDYNWSSGRWS